MNTENNQHFQKTCTRPATIFSLLGWESGLVINEILQHYKNNLQEGEAIAGHLKKAVLNSPRGQMKLDAETMYYTAPAGKFTMEAGATIPVVEWIADFENEWKAFTAIETTGTVTGWTNTYLCY